MATTTSQPIPRTAPLEQGDHLTRDEFERRYEAMPGVKKAELIEGIVHMPSPVRIDSHASPHARLIWWLSHYCVFTPGLDVADNGTVRLDETNEPQPDATLFVASGGQAELSGDDYLEGGPELVAEISASTASIDLHEKLESYRRNGVREYLVWRVLDDEIDWFVLRRNRYVKLIPVAGILRSPNFPGLWLDPAAMIRNDRLEALRSLEAGLATPGHAAFVGKLSKEN